MRKTLVLYYFIFAFFKVLTNPAHKPGFCKRMGKKTQIIKWAREQKSRLLCHVAFT